jgi:hypothetical protein
MADPAAAAARSAAAVLAADYGTDLPDKVEAALADRDIAHRRDQYAIDPVEVAILTVAIATLAWTIVNDLRERNSKQPERETIARQVRITLREQDTTVTASTERVVDVVATEIIRHATPDDQLW